MEFVQLLESLDLTFASLIVGLVLVVGASVAGVLLALVETYESWFMFRTKRKAKRLMEGNG